MAHYLVDVNLPSRFALWRGGQYDHVRHHDDEWTDSQVWAYARQHSLTIITKDADFSDRVLTSQPPPRVIHVKLGNMNMSDFHRVGRRS
jgi:predicted nuclease of predicted toxin-antitoxin system